MYGEKIEDVYAEWRRLDFKSTTKITRKSVSVVHAGKNRVVIIPKKADPLVKMLTSKGMVLIENETRRNLVEEWLEPVSTEKEAA